VLANLPFLLTRDDWQILHLTGHTDYEEVNEAYKRVRQSRDGKGLRATVLAFTEQMADALAAADLVVARAGASTLAEITAIGRASILMPYPHHRDQHQRANARCLVRASAARIVHDEIDAAVNGASLRVVLEQLMGDEASRESMAAAARRLGRGHAAAQIADYIAGLADLRAAQPPLTFRMGNVRAESMHA
jgi:UDP-N-acetylglucosamine--N-acetylmuramyl-(pentapeptide) pyrophosphoryl-undecaprenol N-acetylglucosamine transferase